MASTIFFAFFILAIIIIRVFSVVAKKTQEYPKRQHAEAIAKHKPRQQLLKKPLQNKNVIPPILQRTVKTIAGVESPIISPPVICNQQANLSELHSAKLSQRHLQSNLTTSNSGSQEDENFQNVMEIQSPPESSNPIAENILTLMRCPHSMQQVVLLAEILKQPNFD
jgi:hypothetical protein